MNRRHFIALAAALLASNAAFAQAKLKVGLMLPATGTQASLGTAIENGFKPLVAEQGGKLVGREIEYFRVGGQQGPGRAGAWLQA